MDVVLSGFFLQFFNGGISFRLRSSEDVHFCILGEKLLENASVLRGCPSPRNFPLRPSSIPCQYLFIMRVQMRNVEHRALESHRHIHR